MALVVVISAVGVPSLILFCGLKAFRIEESSDEKDLKEVSRGVMVERFCTAVTRTVEVSCISAVGEVSIMLVSLRSFQGRFV